MTFNLTDEDLGPFGGEDDEVKAFVYKVYKMAIYYNIEHVVPVDSIDNLNCYAWKIIQIFDFTDRNHMTLKLGFE